MAKIKKPAPRKGGPAKPAPAKKPMRRKSKRVTALPHVDVTAPKRKPIPSQVADGALRHNPRATAFPPKHPTVEEQMESADFAQRRRLDAAEGYARRAHRALAAAAAPPKPSLWHRFRSAITGRWVKPLFAKLNPSTTVREKASK